MCCQILVEGPGARVVLRATYGEDFERRCPVIGINHDDAEAYCAWKSQDDRPRSGASRRKKSARRLRAEWMGAGLRGAILADASLGKCRESREVPAQPEPVGRFP